MPNLSYKLSHKKNRAQKHMPTCRWVGLGWKQKQRECYVTLPSPYMEGGHQSGVLWLCGQKKEQRKAKMIRTIYNRLKYLGIN